MSSAAAKIIRLVIGRVLAVLLLLILSFAVFLASPKGLQFIGSMAQHFLPGTLTYQKLSGHLLKDIQIKNFSYTYKKDHIAFSSLSFSWSPAALLNKEVKINKLNLNHADIFLGNPASNHKKAKSDSKPFSLFRDINLNISHTQLTHIRYGKTKQQAELNIKKATLNLLLLRNKLHLNANILTNQPVNTSTHLVVDGSRNHYHLYLNNQLANFKWHAKGQGTSNTLNLVIHSDKKSIGKVTGNANISWQHGMQWYTKLSAAQIDLSQVYHTLPKQFGMHLVAAGNKEKTSVIIDQLSGLINQQPLTGKLQLNYSSPSSFSSAIALQSGVNHIDLNTNSDNTLSANWDIKLNHLSDLGPNFHGELNTQGNISGSLAQLKSNGSLSTNHLDAGLYSLGETKANWQVDMSGEQTSSINLLANDILAKKTFLNKINLQVNGTPTEHQLTLKINHDDSQFSLNLNGALKAQAWQTTLYNLEIKNPVSGTWQLSQPTELILSAKRLLVNSGCLTSSNGQACLSVNWEKMQPWQAQLSLKQLQLKSLNALLPSYYNLQGITNLTLIAAGKDDALNTLKLNTTTQNASLATAGFRTPLQLQHITVDSSYLKKHLKFAIAANSRSNQSILNAQLNMPDLDPGNFNGNTQKVTGKLQLNIGDLKTLRGLMRAIDKLTGSIKADYTLSGTVSKPQLTGSLAINNLTGAINSLHLPINRFDLELNTNQDKSNLNATLTSNKKNLTIKGNSTLNGTNLTAQLQIAADQFLFINTRRYEVVASPNLKININNQNIHTSGSVLINQANIKIEDTRSTATLPTDDIVYTNQDGNQRQPWLLSSNVSLQLGNQVRLSAYGLVGNVTGQVQIIQTPQKATVGNGTIHLNNGKYTIFGQSLTINTGTLSFTHSPLSNPNLNLEASRSIGNLGQGQVLSQDNNFVVGVKLTGTLSNPKTTLYSAPTTLPQQDILSYLLFGQPSGSKSNSVNAALQALSALNLGSSKGGVVQDTKAKLGVSELGVETNTTVDAMGNATNQQTSFVVGKYLGPNLYVRYSNAIEGGNINSIQLQYFLSRRWSIRTERSSGNALTGDNTPAEGIDLLYSVNTN